MNKGSGIAVTSALVAVMGLAWACGSSSDDSPPAVPSNDAGSDSASPDASSQGACENAAAGTPCGTGMVCNASGACVACQAGAACTPTGVCATGTTSCATGEPVCTSQPAADSTSCDGGSCTKGGCYADITIAADTNLSTDPLTPGRTCAEGVSQNVTALTANSATLDGAPAPGCFGAGDEVMLINLQGSGTATTNVGNFELLKVQSVAGMTVTFTTAKTKSYGSGAGDDADIGTDAGKQKVILQRVPSFGKLTVNSSFTLTTAKWNGTKGGVLAFRANVIQVDGTIKATDVGYRPGRWSRDDASCSDSVQTEAGESIGGLDTATTAANVGGSGGIGPLSNTSYNSNDPCNASAGHGTAGEAAKNLQGRGEPAAGGTYGVADGTKLTLGSGSGGNLTCENGFAGPALVDDDGDQAGGIIALFGSTISVSSTGKILANGVTARSSAPSGGYILLRANNVDFTNGTVNALGPVATCAFGGDSNTGGKGRIAIYYKTTVSGTSDPVAFTQQTSTP